jgi:hypothetical protein
VLLASGFFYDGRESFLAHHGEYHLPYRAVGIGEGRLRNPEEQPVLAGHFLEVLQEYFLDLLFRACPDLVDDLYQQLHQPVGNLPQPHKAQCSE